MNKKKVLGWGYKARSESWANALDGHDIAGHNLCKTKKQALKLSEDDRQSGFIGKRARVTPFRVVIEMGR